MSNDLLQAADDARRLLSGFKAVSLVADSLEKVGLLEQRSAEAEASLAAIKPKIEAANADLAGALNEVADARAKSKTLVAAAEARAADITAVALSNSNEAAASAALLTSETEARCNAMVTAAEAGVQEATEAQNKITAEIADLQSKLDKLRAQANKLLS